MVFRKASNLEGGYTYAVMEAKNGGDLGALTYLKTGPKARQGSYAYIESTSF